jgi:uncharacterized protein
VPPAPAARVNDYAALLAEAERSRLETLLAEREGATGVQMAIAIFPSLEGENLEDFAIRLAERWRIGSKERDDGVILLVFVQDRRVRLEVGYGLEPVIPDAVAGRIIREELAPRFRDNQPAAGLEAVIDAVYARVEGGAAARPGDRRGSRPPWPIVGFVGVIALVMLILGWEVMSTAHRNRRRLYTLGPRGWHVPSGRGWYGGGGPWIGGGGSGGGSRGGGGFSGGGGSFGGGGASGRW